MGESFTSHYMVLKNIEDVIRESPDNIDRTIILALEKILKHKAHDTQKLASILYREAANLLREISIKIRDEYKKELSLNILKEFSLNLLNRSSLPASFALGTMPLKIKGPDIEKISIIEDTLCVELDDIFSYLKDNPGRKIRIGRSIIWEVPRLNKLLVFKFAKNREDIRNLLTEIKWIIFLRQDGWARFFEIPKEIKIKEHFLFLSKEYKHPFICFLVSKDYFVYPNGGGLIPNIDSNEFLEIVSKNAKILGMLAQNGILHTAIIPLFHNRTQRTRRDDGGRYIWQRGGRLDRWLDSSLYPNIGKSGIRDFEHIISYDGTNRRRFYAEIGSHFLSFILIIGSYFRMRCAEKRGIGPKGTPVDVREIFDRDIMKKAIEGVVKNYFLGFCGYELKYINFKYMDTLICRLIDEMGVDRYMEEILRIEDQQQMTDKEFREFLLNHGLKEEDIYGLKKGEKDISLLTGPHLGEFSGRISIPELIQFVGSTAALVISSKYIGDISN